MKKVILSIEGMTCSACSLGLEKYLNKQNGIKSAVVNLVMSMATIEYDDNLTIDDLNNFVASAGFKSLGIANLEDEKIKSNFWPFLIYGIIAFLVMYISMAHMWHLPIINIFDMNNYPKVYSCVLLILTMPFLIYGFDIIKSGIKNLIHKMPNMDTLVSIGIIASFLYSFTNVIRVLIGNISCIHNLYFESTIFVIYFVKLGRKIDKSSKEKTKEALKKLVTLTPKYANLKSDEGIRKVTIDEINVGDILIVREGEKVAVDGEIIDGTAHFDESFLTGESKPVKKKVNDNVLAGSINYDGVVYYKAIKIGKNSTISEIVNLVIEATNTKAPISLLADKISSFFVPLILIIALLTFLICLVIGIPFNDSINRFVTILVVACPCALGLATPLAIVVSQGVCASKGILIRSSKVLEIINSMDTIVFDKTGTLTNGSLSIAKFYNYSDLKDEELLSILGSMEMASTHPIAKGIVNYCKENNFELKTGFKTENILGFGIKATYKDDIYYTGSSKLVNKLLIRNDYKDMEEELSKDENSVVYIIKNKKIIGLVGVKDTIREEALEVIKDLKELNFHIAMLSGDNKFTALKVGNELGIENIISDVLPKEKVSVIKKFKDNKQNVIMVGDGVNDAPSLTRANVGISLASGTDIAASSSDVVLMSNNLKTILDLIAISKKTLKIIKQNLFWAFFYNILMIPMAMGIIKNIKINPMIACIFMICSSLLVIFNSLRLKR